MGILVAIEIAMRIHERFVLTSSLLLTSFVAQALPSGWRASSPLRYQSSLHSMIRNQKWNPINGLPSVSCADPLRAHMRNGDTFESTALEPLLLPLKNFENPLTQSGHFYHYTNSPKIVNVGLYGDFDGMFQFLRKEYSEKYFYVATDDESTNYYGKLKANVEFSVDSVVLIKAGPVPGTTKTWVQVQTETTNDLIARYPDLEPCRGDDVLPLLAAEARGVAFLAYYGIQNIQFGGRAQWFEVFGPWAIDSIAAAAAIPKL